MSIWRPTTESCRVEIRGKPIFTSTSRRVSLPVTVGGQDFVWDMSIATFKEIQAVQQEGFDLDAGRFDLMVRFRDDQRRHLEVAAVPRYVVTWEDAEGVNGELFQTFASQDEATRWLSGRGGGLTYRIREASRT